MPGDLIFYAENGSVYHVVMYIGNGKVVHASSSASGIKVSDLYRAHAVSGARFLFHKISLQAMCDMLYSKR